MSAPKPLRLDDGTAWPHPDRGHEAITEIGGSASLLDAQSLTLTRADFFALREIVAAYDHLCRHPVGTEDTVKKLRMLRRAVKESDRD